MLDGYIEEYEWDRSVNKEDFLHFDFQSMPLHNAAFERLVQEIYEDNNFSCLITATIPKKIKSARDTLIKLLRSIIWQFYRIRQCNEDCYIAISLSSNSYKVNDPDNPYRISRKIIDVVKFLRDIELIEFHIGFVDWEKGKSKITRIRPKIVLLDKLRNLPQNIRISHIMPPPIIVRDRATRLTKDSTEYLENEDFQKFSNVVDGYNKFMTCQIISIGDNIDGITRFKLDHKNIKNVDTAKKFIRSIALLEDDGNLSYFRMHGGFWQNMPSIFRHLVRINNAKTVCLDYSAQILNITASISGVQVPADAYKLDLGDTGLLPEHERALIKFAVLIFLNSKSRAKGFAALRQKVRNEYKLEIFQHSLPEQFLNHFYKCLIEKYPFLEDFFFKGVGMNLFKEDATIALEIIERFVDARKVVLPIHDGFMAADTDEEFLRSVMNDVWKQRYGTTIMIKNE